MPFFHASRVSCSFYDYDWVRSEEPSLHLTLGSFGPFFCLVSSIPTELDPSTSLFPSYYCISLTLLLYYSYQLLNLLFPFFPFSLFPFSLFPGPF